MLRLSLTAVFLMLTAPFANAGNEVIAPDWTLTTPDGETVRLSDRVTGQTTILFFWATWCPYCKALMPHLQSIRLEYGDEVEVLAIDIRDDGDPVRFIAESGYDFTLLLDGDAVAKQYGIFGTPGVLIVDGKRRIRFDLRDLPRAGTPDAGESASHGRKAAYLAPFWAAAIRQGIDAAQSPRPNISPKRPPAHGCLTGSGPSST